MLNYCTIDTEFGKSIAIDTDNGTFCIYYGGNLDIYFGPINEDYTKLEIEYRITKERYYLFNTFNTLYERLINYDFLYVADNEYKELYKKEDRRKDNPLIKDNIINWYSDDDMIEEASLLQISKEDEDTIKVLLKRSNRNNYINAFTVRIRNNGSRYHPANFIFMELYNKLTYQNEDYFPQIHMEEYLYKQKKVLER